MFSITLMRKSAHDYEDNAGRIARLQRIGNERYILEAAMRSEGAIDDLSPSTFDASNISTLIAALEKQGNTESSVGDARHLMHIADLCRECLEDENLCIEFSPYGRF